MSELHVDGCKDSWISGRRSINGRHGDGDPLQSVELTRRKTLLLPSRSPPLADLTWISTSRRRGQTEIGIRPHPLLVRPLRRLTDPYGEGRIWPVRQKRISAHAFFQLGGDQWAPMHASEHAALFTWSRDKICKRDQEVARKVRGTYVYRHAMAGDVSSTSADAVHTRPAATLFSSASSFSPSNSPRMSFSYGVHPATSATCSLESILDDYSYTSAEPHPDYLYRNLALRLLRDESEDSEWGSEWACDDAPLISVPQRSSSLARWNPMSLRGDKSSPRPALNRH